MLLKTKTLFLAFSFLTFCTTLSAQQYFIEGPTFLCENDCGLYYLYDDSGQLVDPNNIYWVSVMSSIGFGNPVDVCSFGFLLL